MYSILKHPSSIILFQTNDRLVLHTWAVCVCAVTAAAGGATVRHFPPTLWRQQATIERASHRAAASPNRSDREAVAFTESPRRTKVHAELEANDASAAFHRPITRTTDEWRTVSVIYWRKSRGEQEQGPTDWPAATHTTPEKPPPSRCLCLTEWFKCFNGPWGREEAAQRATERQRAHEEEIHAERQRDLAELCINAQVKVINWYFPPWTPVPL